MSTVSDTPFLFTRTFNAPREAVFEAFSKCEHLRHWWGPKGFTIETCKMDFRPGGNFHYDMRSAGGNVMWGRIAYREIVRPERIVYVVSFSDENAAIVRAPFSETWPLEMENTLTFEEEDGKTTLTLQGTALNATDIERETFQEGFKSMEAGFGATLDELAHYLAKQPS